MGRPPLRAQDFMANNPEHLELLRRMGVSLIHLKDGRVQLVQHATQVNSAATRIQIKNTQSKAEIILLLNSVLLISCNVLITRDGNDRITNDTTQYAKYCKTIQLQLFIQKQQHIILYFF